MIFIYEFLGYIHNFQTTIPIRNGADVLIRQVFTIFGFNAQLFYGLSLLIIISLIGYFNRIILIQGNLYVRYLILMLLEPFHILLENFDHDLF